MSGGTILQLKELYKVCFIGSFLGYLTTLFQLQNSQEPNKMGR